MLIGLALAPWDVLASGHIRSDAEEERRKASGEKGRQIFGDWERNEEEKKVCSVLEEVGQEVGVGDNVQASKWFISPFLSFNLVTELVGSRNCVFDAEDTVRVPHSRYVDTVRW